MRLGELLKMIQDDTNLRITVDGTYIVEYISDGMTHDTSDCGSSYEDYEVVSMHTYTQTEYVKPWSKETKEVAYLSIDTKSKYRVEIWDNTDNDDWAQVAIDKETGIVTALITGEYESAEDLTYEDTMKILTEDGYTKKRTDYDSWEEYDETITLGGVYGTLD